MKTLKRDRVPVMPLPDAPTVRGLTGGRAEGCNDNHPHSGLKMRSPRLQPLLGPQPPGCPVKQGQGRHGLSASA